MVHKITIQPSGKSFSAGENETILAAAARSGITLPHGCKNGACASCKGKIVEGSVNHGNPQPSALAEFEKKSGMTLFCQATAQNDLIIETREVEASGDIEVRRLPCRVQSLSLIHI